jgi:hypothetical protein
MIYKYVDYFCWQDTSQAQLQESTFQPASTVLLLVGLIKRRSSANSWERTAKNCGCCVLDSEGVVYQRGNKILNHKLSRRSGIYVRGNYSAANVHVCGVHDEKLVSELQALRQNMLLLRKFPAQR